MIPLRIIPQPPHKSEHRYDHTIDLVEPLCVCVFRHHKKGEMGHTDLVLSTIETGAWYKGERRESIFTNIPTYTIFFKYVLGKHVFFSY